MPTRPRKVSKVPLYGNPNKTALIEDGATAGATIGLDLWMPNGELATAALLAAFIGVTGAGGSSNSSGLGPLSPTLWSLIQDIPENVLEVAALSTSGLVVRQASGDWITRSIAVASTDRLTITNGDGDAGAPTLDLADLEALSVWGNAGSSTAKPDAITGTANQVLRVNSAGTALAFGAVNLASSAAVTGRLPFANLTQGSSTSVLAVAGGSTADFASLQAAADDRLLARTSGALSFTQLSVGMIPDATITYAKLQNAAALSLLGRASNSSGVLADIVAGADNTVLQRVSGALSFAAVPDAALSANVALYNGTTSFTANQTIASTNPRFYLDDTDAGTGLRKFFLQSDTGHFQIATANDSGTGVQVAIDITKDSSSVVTAIVLSATAVGIGGSPSATHMLDINGSSAGTLRSRMLNSNSGASALAILEVENNAGNALQFLTRSSAGSPANQGVVQMNDGPLLVQSVSGTLDLTGSTISLNGPCVIGTGTPTHRFNTNTSTSASNGFTHTLPTVAAGYIVVNINGTGNLRIPYFPA